MATSKARKLDILNSNKLLFVLVGCLIVCIWIVGLFSDSLIVETKNGVNSKQNIKLADNVDPLISILHEGDEIFIKEANGQIKKINEIIRVEDGNKISQAFLNSLSKMENLKFEKVENNDFKYPINFQEINRNIMDWLNNPPNSPNWKIINFNHQKLDPMNNIVENLGDIKGVPQSIIDQIESFQKQVRNSKAKSTTSDESDWDGDEQDLDSQEITRNCDDDDIEKLIFESITHDEKPKSSGPQQWDVNKTETELQKAWASSSHKTKYFILYICLVLPSFAIYMKFKVSEEDQNLASNLCLSSATFGSQPNRNKLSKFNYWSFGRSLFNIIFGIGSNSKPRYDVNNMYFDSIDYEVKLSKHNLSPTYSILSQFGVKSDGGFLYDLNSETSSEKSKDQTIFDSLWLFSNDSHDHQCQNHCYLYSTDEANSSEADFICPSIKVTKGKPRRK